MLLFQTRRCAYAGAGGRSASPNSESAIVRFILGWAQTFANDSCFLENSRFVRVARWRVRVRCKRFPDTLTRMHVSPIRPPFRTRHEISFSTYLNRSVYWCNKDSENRFEFALKSAEDGLCHFYSFKVFRIWLLIFFLSLILLIIIHKILGTRKKNGKIDLKTNRIFFRFLNVLFRLIRTLKWKYIYLYYYIMCVSVTYCRNRKSPLPIFFRITA